MTLWQKAGLRAGDSAKLVTLLSAMKLPGCHIFMQGHLDTSKLHHAWWRHFPSFGALQRLPLEAQGRDVKRRGPDVAVKGPGRGWRGCSDTDLVGTLNENLCGLSSRPHKPTAEPWTSPTAEHTLPASVTSRGFEDTLMIKRWIYQF